MLSLVLSSRTGQLAAGQSCCTASSCLSRAGWELFNGWWSTVVQRRWSSSKRHYSCGRYSSPEIVDGQLSRRGAELSVECPMTQQHIQVTIFRRELMEAAAACGLRPFGFRRRFTSHCVTLAMMVTEKLSSLMEQGREVKERRGSSDDPHHNRMRKLS